jgi:putative transposase
MGRLARVVVPGYPHHVIQRGNRRQETFFCDEDYRSYLELMAHWSRRCGLEIWAYCLMPNHVHLVVVPQTAGALAAGIGEAHRRYTRRVNFRQGWRGHLWQGRFASYVMDEEHLLAAVRYIEMNPVRAALVERAEDYRWSSAAAHIAGQDDVLVKARPMLELVADRMPDWQAYLRLECPEETIERIHRHGQTGRPLGSKEFVTDLEQIVGRTLQRQKPGPKPKKKRRIK